MAAQRNAAQLAAASILTHEALACHGIARPRHELAKRSPTAVGANPRIGIAILLSVFDARGRRKYLNRSEVEEFLDAAIKQSPTVYALCRLLAETGCRISEALAISRDRIDTDRGIIVFETLKKRKRGIFRGVPISASLTHLLLNLPNAKTDERLWTWSRMTAWRHLHRVFLAAGISGPQASPKGLRHGFAVGAVSSGVPLNLVQRWLGHADIRTTAIYADATGPEELEFAARLRANYLSALARRGSTHHTPPWLDRPPKTTIRGPTRTKAARSA